MPTKRIRLIAIAAAAALFVFMGAATRIDAAPKVLHGPYLQNLTTTSVVVQWQMDKPSGWPTEKEIDDAVVMKWELDKPGKGSVRFGRYGGPLSNEAPGEADGVNCHASLDGLSPDTEYVYALIVDGQEMERGRFKTATEGDKYMFIVYGDSRSQHEVHKKVAAAIAAENPAFVINTGDLVGSGAKASEWDAFFDIEAPLLKNVTLFPSLGNHEGDAHYYFDYFTVPGTSKSKERYYGFRYGNSHILALDSNMPQVMNAEQKKFIKDSILENKDATWRFAFFHHPPVSTLDRSRDLPLQYFVPYLEKGHTDIVFNGHNHFYERIKYNGAEYVTTGGAGAPLYDFGKKTNVGEIKKQLKDHHYVRVTVDGNHLLMEAVKLDGTVFDKVELTK